MKRITRKARITQADQHLWKQESSMFTIQRSKADGTLNTKTIKKEFSKSTGRTEVKDITIETYLRYSVSETRFSKPFRAYVRSVIYKHDSKV